MVSIFLSAVVGTEAICVGSDSQKIWLRLFHLVVLLCVEQSGTKNL